MNESVFTGLAHTELAKELEEIASTNTTVKGRAKSTSLQPPGKRTSISTTEGRVPDAGIRVGQGSLPGETE